MTRHWRLAVAAAFAAIMASVAGCTGGGAGAGALSGAAVVSGTTAYRGSAAGITSVSCTSPGNCSAGGSYTVDLTGGGFVSRAFVVNQVNGTWGTAIPVGFPAAMNELQSSQITSVSCASPGNCSAAGFGGRAFVLTEVSGDWGTASTIADPAARGKPLDGELTSVSCASPGNCSVGGVAGHSAVVVNEVNGTWGPAIRVPGTELTPPFGRSEVTSVSCTSPGNCSAGGSYTPDDPTKTQAFVVSEVNGSWGAAIEVPGAAALNQGGNATVTSVSCGSSGNCAAGGTYWRRGGNTRAFVASEVNETWGSARQVRSPTALLAKVMTVVEITSVSCASAGNCAAVGNYTGTSSTAFVVNEVDGTWGPSRPISGVEGRKESFGAVSCRSPGSCTAAGWSFPGGAFVVSEVNGVWRPARQVPGPGALRKSSLLSVTSLSCAGRYCAGGGSYANGQSNRLHGRNSGHETEAFVFSS